jgi:hypothetical protein
VVIVNIGEAINTNPTIVVSRPEDNFHPQLSNSFRFDIENAISEIPLTKNDALKSIASARYELSGVRNTQIPSAMYNTPTISRRYQCWIPFFMVLKGDVSMVDFICVDLMDYVDL